MIIIGEKINGAIPPGMKAVVERDEEVIRDRARKQTAAGASFIDCAASTDTSIEYETMCWLIDLTCGQEGIPAQPEKRVDIAKSIIDKADNCGADAWARSPQKTVEVCRSWL